MKKLTRVIVLVCIFATILSSVAFAAVDLPIAPRNQTYVVVPCDQYDFGYPDYPDGCVNGKVPVRYEAARSAHVADLVNYFANVYTVGGKQAQLTAEDYLEIRVEYDSTMYGAQGYIRRWNLVPALQMRRVSVGNGAANYHFDVNELTHPNLVDGALHTGDVVRFFDTVVDEDGVKWSRVRIYFADGTGTKFREGYIRSNELVSY